MSAVLTGKARRGGARESKEQPEIAAPVPIYPARAKLARALSDAEQAGRDLEEACAHLARAESDEDAALNNTELSDTEAADRVAFAQRSKGIYAARVMSRESAQTRVIKELKSANQAGHGEYSVLWREVLEERREILRTRIIAAGQLTDDADYLDQLLESAKPIMDLRSHEIPYQILLFADGPEQMVTMAKRILSGYDAILEERKKQI